VIINVDNPGETAAALRRAIAQVQIRVVQLSQCRVCGVQRQELEKVVATLRQLEQELEGANVRSIAAQP
jgi:uncharacterized protein YajQ (UPF0234 family)